MKKSFREPLFHFLVIGAVIFVLFLSVNNEDEVVSENKIFITAANIERLSDNWSKKWTRTPTEDELHGLVDSYIREEVYYREALALGLDKNDTVLRRRLMQKMEFLSNDIAELNTPDETALREYFLAHQGKYELPASISFTHIYFSTDKRGAKALVDAENILPELNVLRAPERGDSFMLRYDFEQETPFEVERLFGKGFAQRLFQTDMNGWQGPIKSGYGFHLVWINKKTEPGMPEFASVIDKVRTDLMFEQRKKMNNEIYERFKERYEIVVEEVPGETGITGIKRAAIADRRAL